jgi:Transposase IS66 family
MNPGRRRCATFASKPIGRLKKRTAAAKQRSPRPASRPSTLATGRLCGKAWLTIASCRACPAIARTGARPNADPAITCCSRLHKFKDDVLRFRIDLDVPFTNNLAEQALRMIKVKMKISGALRALEGAQAFAALRSIIATAAKQRRNTLQTLSTNPDRLIKTFSA